MFGLKTKNTVGFQVHLKNKLKNLAKIVDTVGLNYKFLVKIDGKEIIKEDLKDKDYHEVHPSCLSKYYFLNNKK